MFWSKYLKLEIIPPEVFRIAMPQLFKPSLPNQIKRSLLGL
jgi:hypothetical protein